MKKKFNVDFKSLTRSEIEYFEEIAFETEWDGDMPIRKWVDPIRVKVYGEPTESDLEALNQTIEDIQNIVPHLDIEIVESDENVEIYYVPIREFDNYVPYPMPGNWGLFYYWFSIADYEIFFSTILVSTDLPTSYERKHIIREEFTQMLGLTNDSYRYSNSMFYQGWTTTTEFSEMDKTLLQILYNDDVKPGMEIEEFRTLIQ